MPKLRRKRAQKKPRVTQMINLFIVLKLYKRGFPNETLKYEDI